ncbi:hypothetical protein ACFCX7_04590 [Streptomyces microflavus]|uniref:hypothetical protein n=1 Tax=Streptomyces microflavus TaxID=1919 RepID=UPI0035E2B9E6
MRSIRGLGRRTKAAGGALVLTLTAGGLICGFGLRGDGSRQSPADTCRGALAVEEAEAFFGGAGLEFGGHTSEWVGNETEYCSSN